VIRRLNLPWPADGAPTRDGVVRLLAASDERERAFDFAGNREQVGKIDAVLGCGDLEPDYMCFLADAFHVPLLYIEGNHDRGVNWQERDHILPGSIGGRSEKIDGVTVVGLSWPGDRRQVHALRDESAAWGQALSLAWRTPRQRPLIVISHVPPRGIGDVPEDPYHRGFAAYHWLTRRLNPTLWLHGHTSMAAARDWRVTAGDTTFVNVTGAVLIEIGQPEGEM
jgi:uncharacterized protein